MNQHTRLNACFSLLVAGQGDNGPCEKPTVGGPWIATAVASLADSVITFNNLLVGQGTRLPQARKQMIAFGVHTGGVYDAQPRGLKVPFEWGTCSGPRAKAWTSMTDALSQRSGASSKRCGVSECPEYSRSTVE